MQHVVSCHSDCMGCVGNMRLHLPVHPPLCPSVLQVAQNLQSQNYLDCGAAQRSTAQHRPDTMYFTAWASYLVCCSHTSLEAFMAAVAFTWQACLQLRPLLFLFCFPSSPQSRLLVTSLQCGQFPTPRACLINLDVQAGCCQVNSCFNRITCEDSVRPVLMSSTGKLPLPYSDIQNLLPAFSVSFLMPACPNTAGNAHTYRHGTLLLRLSTNATDDIVAGPCAGLAK